jgi:hypothetical protein
MILKAVLLVTFPFGRVDLIPPWLSKQMSIFSLIKDCISPV